MNVKGLLEGKKGIITGATSESSIGFAIAKLVKEAGGDFYSTYQWRRTEKAAKELADSIGITKTHECDFRYPEQIDKLVEDVVSDYGKIDFVLHSMAMSKKDGLNGKFMSVSKDSFMLSMDVSVYSLIYLSNKLYPYMNEFGSILTLSYQGARQVIPSYNTMGVAKAALESSVRYLAYDYGDKAVRVNAISAGAILTKAASGIPNFNNLLAISNTNSVIKNDLKSDDIAGTAVYLFSDLARSVTGQTVFVDNGYNILGGYDSPVSRHGNGDNNENGGGQ